MFDHYQNALMNALFGRYHYPHMEFYADPAQPPVVEEPREFYFWLGAESDELYKPWGFR